MSDGPWFLVVEWGEGGFGKPLDARPGIVYRGDLIEITFEQEVHILPTKHIRRVVITRLPDPSHPPGGDA